MRRVAKSWARLWRCLIRLLKVSDIDVPLSPNYLTLTSLSESATNAVVARLSGVFGHSYVS